MDRRSVGNFETRLPSDPGEIRPPAEPSDSEPGRGEVKWLPDPSAGYQIAKRLLDISASLLFLVFLLPLIVFIAAAIKLTSAGPVLFKQARLGYHGKPFSFLKFRTMYVYPDANADREFVRKLIAREVENKVGDEHSKIGADPRITPVGRFLRRFSLDELPQFLNVLVGDMTLVGPRPPIPYEAEFYEDWHRLRMSAKPGITGLWQIEGENLANFDAMVKTDLDYITHPSFVKDLRILLCTPLVVLRNESPF